MQTHSTIEPLQPKTRQLEATNGVEGYLYHCVLCDEALVLSKHQINPQKIQMIFNAVCPSCSFGLDRVLGCRPSTLPLGRRLLTNLKCPDAEILLEPDDQLDYQTRRGSTLPRDLQPSITTGIDALDRILVLKKGQLESQLALFQNQYSEKGPAGSPWRQASWHFFRLLVLKKGQLAFLHSHPSNALS